jgi:hypothetical protein
MFSRLLFELPSCIPTASNHQCQHLLCHNFVSSSSNVVSLHDQTSAAAMQHLSDEK